MSVCARLVAPFSLLAWVAASSIVPAQSQPPAGPPGGGQRPFPAPRPGQPRPLFPVPDLRQRLNPVPLPLPGSVGALLSTIPGVVCGTTLIPADSAVDRKMTRPAPADREFTIRTMAPTVCGQTSSNRIPSP